tara:strand:- start:386 stop:670 length:285 start_codon:yes stop_codon:yes gene_type:complete
MAIIKETKTDKIEIVDDWHVQIRTATIIKEDGVELTRSFHRHVLVPFVSDKQTDGSWTHTATDISNEPANVQAIANAAWTDDVKAAYKAFTEAQ